MTSNLYIIGLGGVTCGGKTTVAGRLQKQFSHVENLNFIMIKQDDYYLEEHLLNYLPDLGHYDWDTPSAINFEKIFEVVLKVKEQCQKDANKRNILLIEGNMIFCFEKLFSHFNKRYFFTSPFERCKAIRETRKYEPPDVPGFFEKVCWPAYLEHEQEARKNPDNFVFLNSADYDSNYRTIHLDLRKWFSKQWLLLSSEQLRIEDAVEFVTAPSNGAIATFTGTTRESFENKLVVSLMYECYEAMAYKEMDKLCQRVRQEVPEIDHIAIFHRLGNVPVTESSVIIAVSCPHRRESFIACEYAIDSLKQTVPIWKKEVYKDGSSSWKENQNSCVI